MLSPADFQQLPRDGSRFEALVADLLEAMGYRIIERPAIGADGGRDILVERLLQDFMGERRERVVVQCKHYAHSGSAVGDRDVGVWQSALVRYRARGYLLVTDTHVTENLRRAFQEYSADDANAPRWASYWDVDTLIRHLLQHPKILQTFFSTRADIETPLDVLLEEIESWLRAVRYTVTGTTRLNDRVAQMVASLNQGPLQQRVLVRCVDGEIRASDVEALDADLNRATPQGWLISDTRVSLAARERAETIPECKVFDLSLFLRTLVWGPYFDALAASDDFAKIERLYVDIGCHKTDSSGTQLESWPSIDDYIDRWLSERSRSHISLLGEFGSGKSWFCRHYTQRQMGRYLRNPSQQRLPLLITLRDFTKASTVQQLINDALLEQYRLPFVGSAYEIFQQMSRAGKLLLILDGFDEMARRVDDQTVVDNFWELAKLVEGRCKIILTSRTEYFRWATDSERIFAGEIRGRSDIAPTAPRFELLYLNNLTNNQIAEVIERRRGTSGKSDADKIMTDDRLVEMAQKPVVLDLLLAALDEMPADRLSSQAHVYLYATRGLLLRNIATHRTFTNARDKLYFLCELAWEMITSGDLKIHYRTLPQRIQNYFADKIPDAHELDVWDFDLRNQTLLHRDTAGYYAFAHKSLAEYFVAWKLASALGMLAPEFSHGYIEAGDAQPVPYQPQSPQELSRSLGSITLRAVDMTAVLEFIIQMLTPDHLHLWHLFDEAKRLARDEAQDLVVNLFTLLVGSRADLAARDFTGLSFKGERELTLDGLPLEGACFAGATLENLRFELGNLKNVDFRDAVLTFSGFGLPALFDTSGEGCAVLSDNSIVTVGWRRLYLFAWGGGRYREELPFPKEISHIDALAVRPNEDIVYILSRNQVFTWSMASGFRSSGLQPFGHWRYGIAVSARRPLIAVFNDVHDGPNELVIWDSEQLQPLQTIPLVAGCFGAEFAHTSDEIWTGGRDGVIRRYDISTGRLVQTISRGTLGATNYVYGLSLSPDDSLLAVGTTQPGILIWDTYSDCIRAKLTSTPDDYFVDVAFSPNGDLIAGRGQYGNVSLFATASNERLFRSNASGGAWAFSSDSRYLAIAHHRIDAGITVIDVNTLSSVLEDEFRVDLGHMNISNFATSYHYLKMFRDRGAIGFPDRAVLSGWTKRQLKAFLGHEGNEKHTRDKLLELALDQVVSKRAP